MSLKRELPTDEDDLPDDPLENSPEAELIAHSFIRLEIAVVELETERLVGKGRQASGSDDPIDAVSSKYIQLQNTRS